MIATGGTALRSMVWPSAPSVATSSSWTILTTIWPGVTDLTTVAPTACSRTRSVKLRTTSSATSASSSARRTSRIAASTSASRQRAAPRQPIENATKPFRQIVEQCRCPLSRSQALRHSAPVIPRECGVSSTPGPLGSSRAASGYCDHPLSAGDDDAALPNTFAPEGASRCRALTSGLQDRSAGRKESLSENGRRLNPGRPKSQGKLLKRARLSGPAAVTPSCLNPTVLRPIPP